MFRISLTNPIQIPDQIGGTTTAAYDIVEIGDLTFNFRSADRNLLATGELKILSNPDAQAYEVKVTAKKGSDHVTYEIFAPGDAERNIKKPLTGGQITAVESRLDNAQSSFIDDLLTLGTIVGTKEQF